METSLFFLVLWLSAVGSVPTGKQGFFPYIRCSKKVNCFLTNIFFLINIFLEDIAFFTCCFESDYTRTICDHLHKREILNNCSYMVKCYLINVINSVSVNSTVLTSNLLHVHAHAGQKGLCLYVIHYVSEQNFALHITGSSSPSLHCSEL